MATFPRSARLRGRKHIAALLHRGQRTQHSSFDLCVRPVPELPCHQVIFIIPKRLIKNAVQRNLLRRRLRHLFRTHPECLPKTPPSHIAYIYKKPQVHSYATLRNHLCQTEPAHRSLKPIRL